MRLFNIHSVAEHQKIEGGPFGEFFFEKRLTMQKKPLVSPGIVCYAEKHKKPFWFSSLSQLFQFGTIKLNFVELVRNILVSSCGLEKNESL